MTEESVLLAGVIILGISLALAAIGKSKKMKTIEVFRREGANLGQTDGILERRLPFEVRQESDATLQVEMHGGRVEISLRQTPIPIVGEANVSSLQEHEQGDDLDELIDIVLLDVKRGKSGLNGMQKKIEAAAAAKRVSFDVLRIDNQVAPKAGAEETEIQQLKLSVAPMKDVPQLDESK